MVSTDDEKIAQVSRNCGAEVPFLRDKHTDDHSTVSDVTCYTLDKLRECTGECFDVVVQLMANCPLRTASDIVDAYNNFLQKSSSFQISCFKYSWANPWWAHQVDKDFRASPLFSQGIVARSQDLPELYCPTGAIWIASVEKLLEKKSFYGEPLTFFPLHWISSMDIDTYEDLEIAKSFFTLRNNKIIFNT